MNTAEKKCFFLDVIDFDKTESAFITNITICVLNFTLSLITCAGNFSILFAIRKAQDLHSPSFILLGCLAISDLLVGLICQPLFGALKIAELVDNFSVYCTLRMLMSLSSWVTSGVSFFTLAAVSIDRLLVLTLHLRYNTIVTVRRAFQAIFVLWVFSITIVMSRFWINHDRDWLFFPFAIAVLTFFVISLSTFKIFHIVQRHRRQINDQNMAVSHLQTNMVNVLKCRKSAVTVLYVCGLFMIFYLPYCVTIVVNIFTGFTPTVKIVYDYVTTAVYMNSSLNPLVYCWRIREIRQAVKSAFRRE